MRKTVLLFALSLALILGSCSKVEDEVIYYNPPNPDSYIPMQIGNYWIYGQYETLPGLGDVATGLVDSTYIASDTLINGSRYFVFRSSTSFIWKRILRDSSDYLINEVGERLFCAENIGEILYQRVSYNSQGDTVYFEKRVMERPSATVHVPAGTFKVINAAEYQYFPKAVSTPKERKQDYLYAENVGLVFRNYFSFGNQFSYQLLRYHIENNP
jgi:hypothetical protein